MRIQKHIVVGAGLAGCLLAWRLEQAGQHVTLIGSTTLPNASQVAGGIINPVTGRWMTKSWGFDRLISHAAATYRELEQQFEVELYHSVPLIRYCRNSTDVKRMGRRMRNPRYANVLGDPVPAGDGPDSFEDTHGSFHIKQAAYVQLPRLLQTLRKHFSQAGIFRDETFSHAELTRDDLQWRYHGLQANHIIFTEGVGMQSNPWFNWLPLTPAKGETLILECPTLDLPRAIYHHRKWLLPYGDHTFRLGATYDSDDASPEPTEAGARELLDAARSFIAPQHALTVKQHYAGLRPSTKDIRPFIGDHPTEAGLHIFNGLGSKGASLAPELIRQFLAHLLGGEALDPEIDIARFLDTSTQAPHTDATH
ncbi:MAG: FAD-dependent oxidoreductase [Opitutae bacterium]|nr:FAD-dependent oxidoreductase [Opitutae bacterium]MDG1300097.1 FAD-dependent oxidoreductase [Opitutae bacterium]